MTRKTKKILIVLFCLFLIIWGAEEFSRRIFGGFAGSYPYVESWEIYGSEKEVIEVINELKQEDVSLTPPHKKEFPKQRDTGYNWNSIEMFEYKKKLAIDSLTPIPEHSYENTYSDYWLYFDFYYSDTKETVHTWTRPKNSNVTTFAFIGISSGDSQENYNYINKDYWYLENKKQIRKFKQRFVDKIIKRISERK